MGTTPDCGPHCVDPTPTRHEYHCSCDKCHGKPVTEYSPYFGGRWTPETGWQPLEMVSAYPPDLLLILDGINPVQS
jgi:hypothetical protein